MKKFVLLVLCLLVLTTPAQAARFGVFFGNPFVQQVQVVPSQTVVVTQPSLFGGFFGFGGGRRVGPKKIGPKKIASKRARR